MPAPKKDKPPVTAADAAADEAADQPIVVEFRGEKFEIPQSVLRSAKFAATVARRREFETVHVMLSGDPNNYDRFIAVLEDDEDAATPIIEFFDAFKEASGGNRSTS